jgi:hypothetical protein
MYNIGCRDDDLRKYSLYLICVIIFYMCVLYIKKKTLNVTMYVS